MPRLILLNGAPASGKSTLARRYADDHPLTLCLELDDLRAMLGGWLDCSTKAGLLARRMAIAVADVHLQSDRDVIVPQYLGRPAFVEELEQLADRAGAAFVEIVLLSDLEDVGSRFAARSKGPGSASHVDASRLLERTGGVAELARMYERLLALVARRPRTVRITSIAGDVDSAYDALTVAIDRWPDTGPAGRRVPRSTGAGVATNGVWNRQARSLTCSNMRTKFA